MSPRLADLWTILYRPRETIRRILDSGRDRWSIPVVFLAFFCASADDINIRGIAQMLPGVKLLPTLDIVMLFLLLSATTWVIALFLLSWIATPIGRLLGGTGSVSDVRAALAWGIVPLIWSVVYRIPAGIYKNQIDVASVNVRQVLLNMLGHGGCAVVVIVLALQAIFFLWSLVIATFTLAEAQRFSTEKGFVNLVIAIVLPVLVIAAAVFTLRR
jgi:hypothetical protein